MNDLERTTKQAYGMIAFAGMSDKLPNVCYYNNTEYQFQRPYSEATAKLMDDEVLKMINEQYDRAKQILTEHAEGHAQLAQLLVEREVIFAEDVERIFGKRPWTSRAEELLEAQMRADAERMLEERDKQRELEAQAPPTAPEGASLPLLSRVTAIVSPSGDEGGATCVSLSNRSIFSA
jgi:cell division protease FtsH